MWLIIRNNRESLVDSVISFNCRDSWVYQSCNSGLEPCEELKESTMLKIGIDNPIVQHLPHL